MASSEASRALSTTSVVAATKDQVSSDLAGEAVILSLQTGMYYGLDQVGALIWERLRTPTSVADIRDAIVQQYDIDSEGCERDVLTFLQQLVDQGLIELRDGTPS